MTPSKLRKMGRDAYFIGADEGDKISLNPYRINKFVYALGYCSESNSAHWEEGWEEEAEYHKNYPIDEPADEETQLIRLMVEWMIAERDCTWVNEKDHLIERSYLIDQGEEYS